MEDVRSAACEPTDFFGFSVSRSNALRAFSAGQLTAVTTRIILAASPKWQPVDRMNLPGRTTLAPYPHAVSALLALLLGAGDDRADRDRLEILLPKSIFTDLADLAGADHVIELALSAGVAATDQVVAALQECFAQLHALSSGHGEALAARLSDALNTHLAERYGGMRKPIGVSSGGLAPWQLRLARKALNNLHSGSSLDGIARDCGLSTGHFARGFKRSTGKSPHQWVVLRRIEAAKDMLGRGMPLAEIAVACRFSDQSHLTRAFSQATGLTPGRWRADRAVALETGTL